ncbi:hypothetical protein B0H16DRAFT_1460399 [Mycena metata]|uniref:Uncharacterized protein n=1 Tax=Mycena metata TaxID=1033252 RepID=A0AAD7N9L5_9AGAR|nr:hypothetical protein B0H16DRAFT_1460399 [Mycena metata]
MTNQVELGTAVGDIKSNVLMHTLSIYGRLEHGLRWTEIRPFLVRQRKPFGGSESNWYCGHFSPIRFALDWQHDRTSVQIILLKHACSNERHQQADPWRQQHRKPPLLGGQEMVDFGFRALNPSEGRLNAWRTRRFVKAYLVETADTHFTSGYQIAKVLPAPLHQEWQGYSEGCPKLLILPLVNVRAFNFNARGLQNGTHQLDGDGDLSLDPAETT